MNMNLVNHFTWMVNKLAECNTYKSWSDEFKVKEMERNFETFYSSIKTLIVPNLDKLTVEELRELRFGKWDEESDLWLIPLWFVPLLPVGIELTSISGNKVIYTGDNIDLDIRFGCIAYGILKKGGDSNGSEQQTEGCEV